MDAFFASVEQRDHPEYSGKPVIVGSDPKGGRGRGVVAACSYEARKFGIHSAMPISQAYRLAPGAMYLPVNMERYAQASEEVMDVLMEYAPSIERASIDEAYLDLTDIVEDLDSVAHMIQNGVKRRTGLSCSVGIGSNKVIAKIASGMRKPGGILVVEEGDEASFLAPLPVGCIPGVGQKTREELAATGISTVGQLASASAELLQKQFGVWGERLWSIAHGWDDSPVEERSSIASLGREHTFEEDTIKPASINMVLRRMVLENLREIGEKGMGYRTVVLKVRFSDFETITRSKTYPHPLATADGMWAALSHMSNVIYEKSQGRKKVRLLGVRLSGLEPFAGQTTLDYWLHVSERERAVSGSSSR